MITMVLACWAFGAVPLATWTVKPNDPAVVGVPLSVPLVALRVRLAGNVPVAIVQVNGVVPVAVYVKVNAVPTVPFGGVGLVMTGATVAAVMVMVSV